MAKRDNMTLPSIRLEAATTYVFGARSRAHSARVHVEHWNFNDPFIAFIRWTR